MTAAPHNTGLVDSFDIIDVAADAWVARFGTRALPKDVSALAKVLMDEAPDDLNAILDPLRSCTYAELVHAVARRQRGDA